MKHRWEILANLINRNGYKKIAEIGVSRGINASNILKLCPQIETIFLVDIDFSVFDNSLFYDPIPQKHCIRMYHPEGFKSIYNIDNSLDLIFIDGEHSYEAVKNDIEAYLPLVRKGGIICGHDYLEFNQPGYGVNKAVEEMFDVFALEDDVLENGKLKIWWTYK